MSRFAMLLLTIGTLLAAGLFGTSLGRALLWEGRDRIVRLLANGASPVEVPAGPLQTRLIGAGLDPRKGVHLRIYKEEAEIEVWIRDGDGHRLFSRLPICRYSGRLGPKLREGDAQAPEGFYLVDASSLNPNSAHHLAINLGFPNPADRAKGRTGSFLMIHGGCLSVGCYAMTDTGIDEIYGLVERSIRAGHAVAIHIFPFRMTAERMAAEAASPWAADWAELAEGWRRFEQTQVPPPVAFCEGRTVFEARKGCVDPAGNRL